MAAGCFLRQTTSKNNLGYEDDAPHYFLQVTQAIFIQRPMPITPLTLFIIFLKSGGLTIGDGYATIYPLRKALVTQNQWLSEDNFDQHLSMVQAMPGIFNINLAVYLGKQLYGWKGSAAALLGMILPPVLIFILFATFFDDIRQIPAIENFLRGARPAIIALIILPCLQMWRSWNVTLSTIWIPICTAIAVGLLGVSPSLIVVGLVTLSFIYALLLK